MTSEKSSKTGNVTMICSTQIAVVCGMRAKYEIGGRWREGYDATAAMPRDACAFGRIRSTV
jgi:hypothetical protein